MKTFAAVAAIAGLASAASSGWGAPVYVTDVVTAYTTYCPSATQVTHNGVTYTVTSATTLTITNCPCTVTRPVTSSVSASSYCVTPVSSKAPAPKPVSSGAPAPKPMSSSGYFPPVPAASSTAASSPSPSAYKGAANKVQVAGAGLVALMGLAAAL